MIYVTIDRRLHALAHLHIHDSCSLQHSMYNRLYTHLYERLDPVHIAISKTKCFALSTQARSSPIPLDGLDFLKLAALLFFRTRPLFSFGCYQRLSRMTPNRFFLFTPTTPLYFPDAQKLPNPRFFFLCGSER